MSTGQEDCPGCGAPEGYPPAGPCVNHGTHNAMLPPVRMKCCGIIYEHGALSQARPCVDCPEAGSRG